MALGVDAAEREPAPREPETKAESTAAADVKETADDASVPTTTAVKEVFVDAEMDDMTPMSSADSMTFSLSPGVSSSSVSAASIEEEWEEVSSVVSVVSSVVENVAIDSSGAVDESVDEKAIHTVDATSPKKDAESVDEQQETGAVSQQDDVDENGVVHTVDATAAVANEIADQHIPLASADVAKEIKQNDADTEKDHTVDTTIQHVDVAVESKVESQLNEQKITTTIDEKVDDVKVVHAEDAVIAKEIDSHTVTQKNDMDHDVDAEKVVHSVDVTVPAQEQSAVKDAEDNNADAETQTVTEHVHVEDKKVVEPTHVETNVVDNQKHTLEVDVVDADVHVKTKNTGREEQPELTGIAVPVSMEKKTDEEKIATSPDAAGTSVDTPVVMEVDTHQTSNLVETTAVDVTVTEVQTMATTVTSVSVATTEYEIETLRVSQTEVAEIETVKVVLSSTDQADVSVSVVDSDAVAGPRVDIDIANEVDDQYSADGDETPASTTSFATDFTTEDEGTGIKTKKSKGRGITSFISKRVRNLSRRSKKDKSSATEASTSSASITDEAGLADLSPTPHAELLMTTNKSEGPSTPQLATADRVSVMDTSPTSSQASTSMLAFPSITSLTRSISNRTEAPKENPAENVEKFKSFWDEKLRNTMDKIAHRAKSTEGGAAAFEQRLSTDKDIFHLLLKLYAHQDVVQELYASVEANAAEFDFYIPQLGTFLLHGKYNKQHQLECFLMSRSGESLTFAHRLWWFLKSFGNNAIGYQSEYLSSTLSPEEEQVDLLTAIQQRGGVPAVLMAQGLSMEEVSPKHDNLRLRRASTFAIDRAPALATTNKFENDDNAFAEFLRTKRDMTMYEARPAEGDLQQIALFDATPNFVASLTDLADQLIHVPPSLRNQELREGLFSIHDSVLPSNVIYLPIGNSCHRIKSIQLEECFTFSTKERVPYFLCLEVIDYAVEAPEVLAETKKNKRSLTMLARKRRFGLKLRGFKKTGGGRTHSAVKEEDDEEERDEDDAQEGAGAANEVPPSDETKYDLFGVRSSSSKSFPEGDDLWTPKEDGEGEDFKLELEEESSELVQGDALALTPQRPLNDGDVAARMGEEIEVEVPDAEQKKRMGQWGLPRRVRRRKKKKVKKEPRPESEKKHTSFYPSWFGRRQKHGDISDASPASSYETIEELITDDEDLGPDPFQQAAEATAGPREPVPEPLLELPVKKVETMAGGKDGDASSDDENPRKGRGRDISVSLDFADPDAWKVNFGLEDVLTDADQDHQDIPEQTPELDGENSDEEEEKPIIVFKEPWPEKEERIRKESPNGNHPGWRLLPVIVKSNDDLRQEQFAAQLISQCDRIFRDYNLPLRLRPYNIIATSGRTGLIEAVPDTVSLDSLKRNDPAYTTLLEFFERLFGSETVEFRQARRNFVESLAAYSILCYVFQIKDRHNGNILLDTEGHIIHIDFGFLLTNSPGSNLNFERAPFKLTDEFVELMGGPRSATFRYFRSLCIRAYLALRRNMDKIVLLVEMMLVGNADMPCFAGGKKAVIEGLKERFKPGARTSECQVFVNHLIDRSINNWRTRWYDKYQRAWVGIM
ncbi:hypothetical protein Poli38472_012939 [Pythium oligandrum]|uniref:1-phosphatidylinositol 4-kinase n=1 Tax=Pythium oligandrum TaxID=41045 RepID=A0A8K1CL69_PYTOL|nr:hypothetical protein Poli38472_012939 [Pythium oligandrum]|eukprot:TMW64317.1 hypothetical protein Poli38472_012939 [Pythium oligandrum]